MLDEFDLKYVTSKSVKRRIVAEHLAELPVEFMKGEKFLFPDEEVTRIEESLWKMYFDGAANQKGYGVGVILVAPAGAHIPLAIKLKYTSTNNTAEYEACILGIEATLSLGIERVDVFGDSNLIISQV